jgi:hypothetical protein
MSFMHEVKLIELAERLFEGSQHPLDDRTLDEIGVVAFEIVALVQQIRVGHAAAAARARSAQATASPAP